MLLKIMDIKAAMFLLTMGFLNIAFVRAQDFTVDDFKFFGRYKLVRLDKKAGYTDASKECKRRAGNLIRVDSQEINDALKGMIKNSGDNAVTDHVLIGLRKYNTSNEEFVWDDGEKFVFKPGDYQNWGSGEGTNNDESCVVAKSSTKDAERGQWADIGCEIYKRKFVCQIDYPVRIKPKKPRFTFIAGEPFKIQVDVTSYVGPVTVEIKKQSRAVWPNRHVGNGTVTVNFTSQVTESNHAGTYTVEAYASDNKYRTSATFEVVIHERAKIVSIVRNHTNVPEAGDVSVTCSASGKPTPRVHWEKDGKRVGGGEVGITQASGDLEAKLHVTQASKSHSGTYTCVASNTVGELSKKSEDTKDAYLTVFGKPSISSYAAVNCSEDGRIDITWAPGVNGESINYTIEILPRSTGSQPRQETLGKANAHNTYQVRGLEPLTEYKIKVIPCTDTCYNASASDERTVRTAAGVPNRVTRLTMSKNETKCSTSWHMKPEAAKEFNITITWTFNHLSRSMKARNETETSNVTSGHRLAWAPKPNRRYWAHVAAINCAGTGKISTVSEMCVTESRAPDLVPKPSIVDGEDGSGTSKNIVFTLPDESNGPITCIFVIVKLGDSDDTQEREITEEILRKLQDAASKITLDKDDEYLAVAKSRSEVVGEQLSLTIGDGKETFCKLQRQNSARKRRQASGEPSKYTAQNRPLNKDTKASIYVVTATMSDKGPLFASSQPVVAEPVPGLDLGFIIGLAIGILVLVIVVIIIVICCCKQRSEKEVDEDGNVVTYVPKQEAVYANLALNNGPRSHTDIPLETLQNTYENLNFNDKAALLQQFQKIKEFAGTIAFPVTVAKAAPKKKNRYKNILAYDVNRVHIRSEGDGAETYINASYVHGQRKENKFIATQGPLPSTVQDFWQMVMEQNARVIVMLAKCVEAGKKKCHEYWPGPGKTIRVGNMVVENINEKSYGGFVRRAFKMSHSDQRDYTVEQFQFMSWPDHGVPVTTSNFFRLHKEVVEKQGGAESPIVVHCSAGAGRTGTFIGYDRLLEEATDTGRIDPYNCVIQMREQRMDMVQTCDQYNLLHKLLLEWYLFRDTGHDVSSIEDKIMRHQGRGRGEHTPINTEYDNLGLAESFGGGAGQNNIVIVRMSHEQETPCINASRIETYGGIAMIASEGPKPSTIEYFWRAVLDSKVTDIMMLGNTAENAQYWPTASESRQQYGHVSVELVEERTSGEIIERKLLVKKKSQSKTIHHLQYNGWEGNTCPVDCGPMLTLASRVRSNHMNQRASLPLVQCSDGLGATGTLCAIISCLEQVECEDGVDVFRNIKDLRDYRTGLVSTLDQYLFCYRAVHANSEAKSLYGNAAGVEMDRNAIYQNVVR